MQHKKHTILIIGASGFIGNALYRELLQYFETFGTYCLQQGMFEKNKVFFKYDAAVDSIEKILVKTNPSVIISAFKGNFRDIFNCHKVLTEYVAAHHESRLLFLSSAAVFDGDVKFPKYENDIPKSKTIDGKHKIRLENFLLEEIPAQTAILRLPLVLGIHAPIIIQLREATKHHAEFEVFPNRIISATTADKVAQQIHYIINQNSDGIYHLASEDVIHYDDLFRELCERNGGKSPIFKNVFQRNEESYFAILPKKNKLPKNYRITIQDVIKDSTLEEDITTLKKVL